MSDTPEPTFYLSLLKPGDQLNIETEDEEVVFFCAFQRPGGPVGTLYNSENGFHKIVQLLGTVASTNYRLDFSRTLEPCILKPTYGRLLALVTESSMEDKDLILDIRYENFEVVSAESDQNGV